MSTVDPQMEWRKKIDDGASLMNASQVWLVSFTDLFSILLCFFIMMFSMKDPDIDMISKISGRGGGGYAGQGELSAGDTKGANIQRVEYAQGLDLSYLNSVLSSTIDEAGLTDKISITDNGKYLVLQVTSQGQDDVVRLLGGALAGLPNAISVVSVPSGAREGEWDNTLERAAAYAGFMRAGGYRRPLKVMGMGSNPNAQGAAHVELHIEGYAD